MFGSGTFRAVIGLALAGFAAAGCGPSGPQIAEVSGKVTYKGEPVGLGQVYFKLVGSDAAGGSALKADGTYASSGIPVGKCKVTVKTKSYNPKPQEAKSSGPPAGSSRPSGSGPPGGGGSTRPSTAPKVPDFVGKTNPNDGPPGKFMATPDKYESEATTTLEFEVKPGKNTFDIELKD